MEYNKSHYFYSAVFCYLVASCKCHRPLKFGNPPPCYIIPKPGGDVFHGYAHLGPECETRVGPKEKV